MACPYCGNWSVKADRSLAGRLVCGRCGRALGLEASRRAGRPMARRRVKLPWWGWLAVLLAVSAGLASLQRPISPPSPQIPRSSGALSWR